MTTVPTKSKAPSKTLSTDEIKQTFSRLQSDIQTLASKIGELESEADEHEYELVPIL
ncbi:hypothetical protein BD410DRAFT_834085 [Rickenella mellea]|uniref:Uncharacterized protein n=1 Tax=Rickenella mellea TaxID=50990 RepID=A0A4R5XFE0_9AGAM|nr:hypothetical protein BD410DRAFT_834085 [Rickenella mellea]